MSFVLSSNGYKIVDFESIRSMKKKKHFRNYITVLLYFPVYKSQ